MEPCDDDAGISQIKGDWQPLSIFGDGGGPRDGNIDVVAIVRKAEPVGSIISSKSGKELTKREVVLCDDSGFDIRCTFWGDVDPGVPSRGGAFTSFKRVVSRRGGRGWFLFC